MAIPPDPIDEIIVTTDACVVGEITFIMHQWKQAAIAAPKEKGMSDVPGELAQQTVKIRVDDVVFGSLAPKGAEIEITKPAGDYTLRPGNKGPFLLRQPTGAEKIPVIVGRYGPDSYRQEVIAEAAKRNGKS